MEEDNADLLVDNDKVIDYKCKPKPIETDHYKMKHLFHLAVEMSVLLQVTKYLFDNTASILNVDVNNHQHIFQLLCDGQSFGLVTSEQPGLVPKKVRPRPK